jgi:N-acyl-D-amino-acid deacylase
MLGRILLSVCAILTLFLISGTPKAQPTAQNAAPPTFDVVLRDGHIIDGTGSPWYSGDIGIRDGHIVAIGNLASRPAKRTIDAQGLIVAPGFIDMLGQSELTILVDPRLPSKIYQGITTEITGEGDSIAPQTDATIAENRREYERYKINADWRTFREYFARLEKQGMGINLGTYVGAT